MEQARREYKAVYEHVKFKLNPQIFMFWILNQLVVRIVVMRKVQSLFYKFL